MRRLALVLLLLAPGCASGSGGLSNQRFDEEYYRSDECVACGTDREIRGRTESIRLSDLGKSPLLAVLHRHEWALWVEAGSNWIACGRHDLNNELCKRLESSAELRDSLHARIGEGEITAADLERALHVRERRLEEVSAPEREVYDRVLAVARSSPGWAGR